MNNYEIYNERMALGIEDKLFFLAEIGAYLHTVVDFGCADATLGKALYRYNPDIQYIGIDNDEYMLESAEMNFPQGKYFLSLEDYLDNTIEHLYGEPFLKHTAIIFSSVLHEIFSYDYKINWDNLAFFEYVVVRDMGLPQDSDYEKEVNFSYPLNNIIDYLDKHEVPISYYTNRYKFGDYYQLWLKYRYLENWNTESLENYFACSQERIREKLSEFFIPIHHRSFVHQYTKNTVIKTFGFDPFIIDTHYELIAKNKIPF